MGKKERVGKEIAKRIKHGDVIGVGTGSTVEAALQAIGARCSAEGLQIAVLPTSLETAWLCEELGLTVLDASYRGELAWGFDGADAVDERLRAIKGKGGALLREKIIAARCSSYTLIVDDSKFTDNIAALSAVPVEIIPEARSVVERRLLALGATEVALRQAVKKHGPVITEAGNLILDTAFPAIGDGLEQSIKTIVGVVESGIFTDFADEILIAEDGSIRRIVKNRGR